MKRKIEELANITHLSQKEQTAILLELGLKEFESRKSLYGVERSGEKIEEAAV